MDGVVKQLRELDRFVKHVLEDPGDRVGHLMARLRKTDLGALADAIEENAKPKREAKK